MCRPLSAAATDWTASPCWSASLSQQMGPVVKPWTSLWESGWSMLGCRSMRASSCSMALMTYDSWWVTCSMSSQESLVICITYVNPCCICLFMVLLLLTVDPFSFSVPITPIPTSRSMLQSNAWRCKDLYTHAESLLRIWAITREKTNGNFLLSFLNRDISLTIVCQRHVLTTIYWILLNYC